MWRGVLGGQIVTLEQRGDNLNYVAHNSEEDTQKQLEPALRNFLRLEHNLMELYTLWANGTGDQTNAQRRLNADFATIASALGGLRLLRQDPIECLFSFLCSQNNNIPRISLMLSRLCEHYGASLYRFLFNSRFLPRSS